MRTGKGENVSCDHVSPALWRALDLDLQTGWQRWETRTSELHTPSWESQAEGKGTVGQRQDVNKNVSGARDGPTTRVEQVLGQICEVCYQTGSAHVALSGSSDLFAGLWIWYSCHQWGAARFPKHYPWISGHPMAQHPEVTTVSRGCCSVYSSQRGQLRGYRHCQLRAAITAKMLQRKVLVDKLRCQVSCCFELGKFSLPSSCVFWELPLYLPSDLH